jgi:ribosome-associated protein
VDLVRTSLDDDKAQDVVVIDLSGKTDFADFMVIATGTSQRHVASMAEHLREKFKSAGQSKVPVEGLEQGDWVLVDGGDIVVHVFRADVRKFYELEKIWGALAPRSTQPLASTI